VGKIKNYIRTINFNNLIENGSESNCKSTNFPELDENPKKIRKVSLSDITFTSGINYGWYSQEFVNKKFDSVFDRNNNIVPHPKIHKYLTPENSTVLVTHVSSDPTDKPFFSDTYFVGEVTKYLESVYFN